MSQMFQPKLFNAHHKKTSGNLFESLVLRHLTSNTYFERHILRSWIPAALSNVLLAVMATTAFQQSISLLPS